MKIFMTKGYWADLLVMSLKNKNNAGISNTGGMFAIPITIAGKMMENNLERGPTLSCQPPSHAARISQDPQNRVTFPNEKV